MIALTANWIERLFDYQRIFVAFSGGLDSTVLLAMLAKHPSLVSKLTAVHINHGLSDSAMAWQQHCQAFCKQLKVPLILHNLHFVQRHNLEDRARKARYQLFAELIENPTDCLVMGHHQDDQAETLLLKLFRGAGVEGLSAMKADRPFAQGQLFRPLLNYSRQCLQDYAQCHQLAWVEDESNQQVSFSRNYLRHQVLPLLSRRWPSLAKNLVRTVEHCQQAQLNLDELACLDCPSLMQYSFCLPINDWAHLPSHRIINILRHWIKLHKFRSPNAVTFNRLLTDLIQAKQDTRAQVSWDDISVRRFKQSLYFVKARNHKDGLLISWDSFPQAIPIEDLGWLHATASKQGIGIPSGSKLDIRFRQGGELFFFHGQHKQLKKLFQDWQIPPWLRDSIPLVYIDEQLACVVGHAISDKFYQVSLKEVYELQLLPFS